MPQTIGEQLKQAREERGLSLEQAAQVTRIRIHYLKALENDLRDQIPSRVQGRGFLRLYADFLGLPAQPLLDQWEGHFTRELVSAPEALPVEEKTVKAPPEEIIKETRPAEGFDEESVEIEPAPEAEEIIQISPHIEKPGAPPLAQSGAILAEIGKTLRQRRESISLSLSDVEHYTRVRQHYLRALEAGRFDDLPSAVQGRGMLSNYAEFLNLDVDALLGRFADALQARRVELQPAPPPNAARKGQAGSQPAPAAGKHPPATRLEAFTRLLSPDLMVIGSLIIVLVIFVIWLASRVTTLSSGGIESTAPSISEVLLETSQPSVTFTPAPTQATPIPPGLINPSNGGNAPVEEGALPPNANSPVQVYIIAHQRAWMRVTVDGKIAFSGRVVPGNAYPFAGSEKIEMLTGNAAALQVFYNQDDLGALGITGQVVDLIFLPDSLITPTPAFTPTFTPTLPATLTPQPTATLPTATITPFVP